MLDVRGQHQAEEQLRLRLQKVAAELRLAIQERETLSAESPDTPDGASAVQQAKLVQQEAVRRLREALQKFDELVATDGRFPQSLIDPLLAG